MFYLYYISIDFGYNPGYKPQSPSDYDCEVRCSILHKCAKQFNGLMVYGPGPLNLKGGLCLAVGHV